MAPFPYAARLRSNFRSTALGILLLEYCAWQQTSAPELAAGFASESILL